MNRLGKVVGTTEKKNGVLAGSSYYACVVCSLYLHSYKLAQRLRFIDLKIALVMFYERNYNASMCDCEIKELE